MAITSRTKEHFRKVVDEWVARPLDESAAKRTGRATWVRRCVNGRTASVVEVRSHSYSHSNAIQFTVEFGVLVAGYAERAWEGKTKRSTASAAMTVRVGELADVPEDVWWEVVEDSIARRALSRDRHVAFDDTELQNLVALRIVPLIAREWTIEELLAAVALDETGFLRPNSPSRGTTTQDVLAELAGLDLRLST